MTCQRLSLALTYYVIDISRSISTCNLFRLPKRVVSVFCPRCLEGSLYMHSCHLPKLCSAPDSGVWPNRQKNGQAMFVTRIAVAWFAPGIEGSCTSIMSIAWWVLFYIYTTFGEFGLFSVSYDGSLLHWHVFILRYVTTVGIKPVTY